MNLPGFSAEASLYQTSGQYGNAAAGISTQAGRLLPQQLADFREHFSVGPYRAAVCDFQFDRCVSTCRRRTPAGSLSRQYCIIGCLVQHDSCLNG
jgi:hypothetical protein